MRFRIRGYNADFTSTYINGIPMDNLDNGYTPFGLWGGLNDVFRNRDINIGVRYNTFAFGDIGNSTNIDARASKQRSQTNIGYSNSNRSYDQRIIFTHSTGLNKNGWAFTVSASWRYAGEGYVAGTYFNGYSWFAAIDKKLWQRQIISLIAFNAPAESGRQGAATQEMIDIAGTHYHNPFWGHQNGKKRNANISKTNQPVIILSHDFRITNKTDLTTSSSYSFGERSYSALDWYNAPDPRPDYYHYLPSYYKDDPYQQQQIADNLMNNEAAINNTSGKTNLTLNFLLQSLDDGIVRTTSWQVDYVLGDNPTAFIPVATSPSNLTTGPTFASTRVTVNFGNALDNQSSKVWIRIVTLSATSGSGSRASTSIDDVQISWQ